MFAKSSPSDCSTIPPAPGDSQITQDGPRPCPARVGAGRCPRRRVSLPGPSPSVRLIARFSKEANDDAMTYQVDYLYGWSSAGTDYEGKVIGQADRAISAAP